MTIYLDTFIALSTRQFAWKVIEMKNVKISNQNTSQTIINRFESFTTHVDLSLVFLLVSVIDISVIWHIYIYMNVRQGAFILLLTQLQIKVMNIHLIFNRNQFSGQSRQCYCPKS